MSKRLCVTCNRIFTDMDFARADWAPHHSNPDDLHQAAASGCYICRWIKTSRQWNDLSYLNSHGFPIRFSVRLFENRGDVESSLNMLTVLAVCDIPDEDRRRFNRTIADLNEMKEKWIPRTVASKGDNKHYFWFSFHLRSIEEEAIDIENRATTPQSARGNLAITGLLEKWFTECCDKHPLCLPPTPAFRPTRLLLIEDEHSARVVETKDWAIDHRYVALSHCWGTISRLELKKGNMADLLKHVDVAGLPTTYREGISVSLALGFSYIWIDSLCIIQDDDEDWTKEATRMKDVFEHCSVNLSTTAAADSSQSCFTHWDPALIPPPEVTVHRREKARFRLAVDWTGLRRDDIFSSPLHSRAWVFQEANLSRRRIDLARSQAWWHCQQNWACETHPSGVWDIKGLYYDNVDKEMYRNMLDRRTVDSKMLSLTSSLNGPRSQASTTMTLGSPSLEDDYCKDLEKHWFEQVEIYSSCAITKTKDRLVAFAGIAQRYAQNRRLGLEDYLAGIWREELLRSLAFWSIYKTTVFRPDRYRAPSWSWASLEGEVRFSRGIVSITPLCKVVHAKVIHQFEHYPAGEVRGGVIHIRGRLLELGSDSQSPKRPGNHSFEELLTPSKGYYGFDECGNVRDSTIPQLAISYLEHPQDKLDQRKEGIVDGATRKYISFNDVGELPQHLRLFILPIIIEEEMYRRRGIFILLCQTLDDYLARNAIYQRVGLHHRHLFDDRDDHVFLNQFETLPETDIYII